MKYEEFMGQVQQRARLPDQNRTGAAIRATLQTLAERLTEGAASNLAAQLPSEVGRHLQEGGDGGGERFDLDEFFTRVSKREQSDRPATVQHVRAVFAVLNEAVSAGEMEKVRQQLPEDYDPIFEAGSEGQLQR